MSPQEQDSWKLVPASLEEFRELWSEYDDGTRTITPRDLHDLLIRLTPPLGLGPTVTNIQLLKFVSGLNIPLVNGRVPFHRVLFELVRRVSETEIPEGKMKDGIDEMVSNAFGRGEEGDELMNFNIAIIVTRMQRKWRAVVASNKVKNSVARRRARTIPTVAMSDFHTLLERKADFRADVALSCLEGRPWKFDGADGMGHLADWAVQGLARPHGLRNQMSLMVRRQTRQPSEGQQGLSGFAGMMKRITLFSAPRKTKLGPQATEAHQGHATMEDLASQALLEVGESDEDEAEELRKLASPRNIFAGLHRAGWRSAVTRDSQH